MITSLIVRVDQENNAEEFWAAFRDRLPEIQDADPQTHEKCCKLLKNEEVELFCNDIDGFLSFVESLPGYYSGDASYAPAALILQPV